MPKPDLEIDIQLANDREVDEDVFAFHATGGL
jgi:hypothetical protein